VAAHGHGHRASGASAGGGLVVLLIGLIVVALLLGGLGGSMHRSVGRRWWVVAFVVGLPLVLLLAGGGVYVLGLVWHTAESWARWLLIVLAAIVGSWVVFRRAFHRARFGRRRRRASLAWRLRWHLHPGPGFASAWALRRRLGLPPARRVARHARPSVSWLGRRLPGAWRGYCAFEGWAYTWLGRRRVYSPLENMRLVIAPPQTGKSASAAGTILDAPGPVVATSIRGDLIAATAGLRGRRGRIQIWNPEGVGDYASTLGWNPVEGCQDVVAAVRRAGYMVEAVSASGLSDESFWTDQASLVLGSYLHAAALTGGDLRDVHRWILTDDDAPVRILARHPGAAEQALPQATQYLALPARTRAGITTTINNTLKFMQHPGVVAAVTVPAGEGFGFEAFLQSRDTLYLVAADAKTSPMSPLFTALCAEITWAARQIGGIRRPARVPRERVLGSRTLGRIINWLVPPRQVARLDPPLSMVLDEVANIAPVPAAEWATWAAGSGVWLHLYAQSWAQLADRWGEYGAETIWQACRTKSIYGGTTEHRLCEMVEAQAGQIRVRGPDDWRYTRSGKPRRRPSYEDVPVLRHAELRQIPAGHAVVFAGAAPPVIVRPEKFMQRADVRLYQRRHGPLVLPVPARRQIPQPVPDLLADQQPGPADTGAPPGNPGGGGGPGWPRPTLRDPSAAHWTDAVPEIPRALFAQPAPVEPPPPPSPAPQPSRATPRPPARPAPWERSTGDD
jgi:hypothetical protein